MRGPGMARRVEEVLRGAMPRLDLSVGIRGGPENWFVVRAVFPDGYVVEDQVPVTGRLDYDVARVLVLLASRLGVSRDIVIVTPRGETVYAHDAGYWNRAVALYRALRSGRPLYVTPRGVYDLVDGSAYRGLDAGTLDLLLRRYGSWGLVRDYLFKAVVPAWAGDTVRLWLRDGGFEERRGSVVGWPLGRYTMHAVVYLDGRIYRTIAVDRVVAEEALGTSEPGRVARAFIDAFSRWLRGGCGVSRGLWINMYRLYMGVRELGAEPPDTMRYLARISSEAGSARCPDRGVLLYADGVWIGGYAELVERLKRVYAGARMVAGEPVLGTSTGREYRGVEAYRFMSSGDTYSVAHSIAWIRVAGSRVDSYTAIEKLVKLVKVYGWPAEALAVTALDRDGSPVRMAVFRFRNGMALLAPAQPARR